MARGLGAINKTNKCNCENPTWDIITTKTVKSGKQYGKKVYVIRCSNCKSQWETSAKYAQELK
jgi:hypothetical protein